VQLGAFSVVSEREGKGEAIQAQRRDMNIIPSISLDLFGDVTDGSVGEFLKYLPGRRSRLRRTRAARSALRRYGWPICRRHDRWHAHGPAMAANDGDTSSFNFNIRTKRAFQKKAERSAITQPKHKQRGVHV